MGFLLLKPHFALVLAVLVLICREWAMLAGAALSISAQVMATIALLGTSVVWDYAGLIWRFPQLRPLLEPRPEQMHSILSLTNQLPNDWGIIAWTLLSGLAIFRTILGPAPSAPPRMNDNAIKAMRRTAIAPYMAETLFRDLSARRIGCHHEPAAAQGAHGYALALLSRRHLRQVRTCRHDNAERRRES